jgi:ribosomal protein L31
MKSKFHFIKKKVYVQSTDGSIIKLNIFSKISVLKLNIDIKSHLLWKVYRENISTENFVKNFMKKYLPTK